MGMKIWEQNLNLRFVEGFENGNENTIKNGMERKWEPNGKKNGNFGGNENGKPNFVREPKWDEMWGNQSEDEIVFRGKEGVSRLGLEGTKRVSRLEGNETWEGIMFSFKI